MANMSSKTVFPTLVHIKMNPGTRILFLFAFCTLGPLFLCFRVFFFRFFTVTGLAVLPLYIRMRMRHLVVTFLYLIGVILEYYTISTAKFFFTFFANLNEESLYRSLSCLHAATATSIEQTISNYFSFLSYFNHLF